MARNSRFSLILVGMVVMITVLAGVANAKGVTPSLFATQKGCESAVNAGEGAYKFYVPKYLGGNKKNPVDGVTSVVAPLEAVACVQMDTTAGKKWVAQPEGAEFRFWKNADGSFKETPYARHDCGNKVYGIVYPAPEVSVSEKKAEAEVKAPAPRSGYQIGDPCIALTPDLKQAQGAITQVFADGGASCDAVVEVVVPSKGKAIAQYIICPLAGGLVGYQRSGATGAISGAVAGAGGTYVGRELGGENWGWVGCATGPAVGLIKWGKGGVPSKGGPVNPPLGPVNPIVGGPVNPPLGLVNPIVGGGPINPLL